ncbi:MAG: 3'-5' exonuclease [Betaproteobacteria bacterium]
MDLNAAIALVSSQSDYRVLRRVSLSDQHVFAEHDANEPLGRLAVIDTETTGMNPDEGDRIIDLAIASCDYGMESGKLYRVVARYEGLEDPEFAISPEITALTGITDAMVRGQRLDEQAMVRALDGVRLIVCHNASFDRKFLESRFPRFSNVPFACTFTELPWSEWGVGSGKLDYIGFRFGLFHDAHRARADVDMLTAILNQRVPGREESLLGHLLKSARAQSARILAFGLPFESKDAVKARGYRWFKGGRSVAASWWIETQDVDAELSFLKQYGCKQPGVFPLNAKLRYRSFDAVAEILNRDGAGPL